MNYPCPRCGSTSMRGHASTEPMGLTCLGCGWIRYTDDVTHRLHDAVRQHFRCRCGARHEQIEILDLGGHRSFMPGPLVDECTCPRCIGCALPLAADQRCWNLDCRYCGLIILVPD